MIDLVLRVLALTLGGAIIYSTLISAIRTFVLPRSENVFLTRLVFQIVFKMFSLGLRWKRTYPEQDRLMAFFSPVGLLLLPIAWLTLITIGYTGIYWAFGVETWYDAFLLSGSSLLTLGFAPVDNLFQMLLAFSEATIGLIMVALLIAYLPTMYAAFTEREVAVSMLEVRAGDPPTALEMIRRMHRIRGLEYLTEEWIKWERWFVDLEQTHTSFIPLVFFRSPHVGQSWVVAAGTILDAAAITASTVDKPRDPHAELCIRAGYLALRNIVDFFGLPHNPQPLPTDPISVSRVEFDIVYDQLALEGVPLKPDREQAWRDFSGWRVNYDRILLLLAGLTMAPEAPWSGDRAIQNVSPALFRLWGGP